MAGFDAGCPLPNLTGLLHYRPEMVDPALPEGCLLCADAEDADAIELNAVSLPLANFGRLAEMQPFFEAFSRVLVVCADPERRRALAEHAREALPAVELWVTAQSAYEGCRSLCALREKRGLLLAPLLWQAAVELPPRGLIDVSRIPPRTLPAAPRIPSGIPGLDARTGGLFDGEVTVWTGRQGAGKTVLLGMPILSALREGRRVCVYSGELDVERYADWLMTQAAGPDWLEAAELPSGLRTYVPQAAAAARITAWWRERLFLCDNRMADAHDPEQLLSYFRYAIRRRGATVLALDNLMTLSLRGEDLYRAQSRIVGALADLAHAAGVQVHLVAHRRKGGASAAGSGDEVSGSADIINRADNVFAIARADGGGATLEILKNRDFGARGRLSVRFDPPSRRFYDRDPAWPCGWE